MAESAVDAQIYVGVGDERQKRGKRMNRFTLQS